MMDALLLLEALDRAFPLPPDDVRHHHLVRQRDTGSLGLYCWIGEVRYSLELPVSVMGIRIPEVIENIRAQLPP